MATRPHRRRRTRSAVLVVFMVLMQSAPVAAANLEYSYIPVLIMNCQTDPGGINPSSGRAVYPDDWKTIHGCAAAVGVGITIYNRELGFQSHCETDINGRCLIQTIYSPTIKVTVVEHTATLAPGFAPRESWGKDVFYTEYAGIGIVNLPVEPDSSTVPAQRNKLDITVSGCSYRQICAEAAVLAQVSPADLTVVGWPWLANDRNGVVSFDLDDYGTDSVDLMFDIENKPLVHCYDWGDGTEIEATWIDEREGTFVRITPVSTDGVFCSAVLEQPLPALG